MTLLHPQLLLLPQSGLQAFWCSSLNQTPFILNNVLHLNIIKYINDICFFLFCLPWGLLLLLSLLIHDRLHGWAGSFCPEKNHTAKLNFMLSVNHFDDSGPDKNSN